MQPVSKSRHNVSNLQQYVLIFCFSLTLTLFDIFQNHKSIQIKSLNIVKINKSSDVPGGTLKVFDPFYTKLRRDLHDFPVSDGDNSMLNTDRNEAAGTIKS